MDDPIYPIASQAQRAIGIEMNPVECEHHRKNLPNAVTICDMITPDNAFDLLYPNLESSDVDILKIDIDSYDCHLAQQLLSMIVPKFIIMEVNMAFPPPFEFWVEYDPAKDYDITYKTPHHLLGVDEGATHNSPFFSCSLSHMILRLHRIGYDFVFFEGGDAVFQLRAFRKTEEQVADAYYVFSTAILSVNGASAAELRKWYLAGSKKLEVLKIFFASSIEKSNAANHVTTTIAPKNVFFVHIRYFETINLSAIFNEMQVWLTAWEEFLAGQRGKSVDEVRVPYLLRNGAFLKYFCVITCTGGSCKRKSATCFLQEGILDCW